MIVNKDTKLHDVVISEPSITAVLSRFDNNLGIGDKTVRQMCDERGIEPTFFIAILNTYISDDYAPADAFRLNGESVNRYLKRTIEYYDKFLIPNIEQHFNLLIHRSSGINSNLELMRNFFFEIKEELALLINSDVAVFKPIDTIEDKLNDLVSMFVIHLTGSYNINLCQAVLFAIIGLRKDISQYNRICRYL